MLNRMKSVVLTAAALGIALSATACSSLTRPEEITIAAEPLPTRAQPSAPQAPSPGGMPAQPGNAAQAPSSGG